MYKMWRQEKSYPAAQAPRMASAPLHLELRNDLRELGRLYDEVARFATGQGLEADVGHLLHLALEELVTNVIRHGCRPGHVHRIGVRVWCEPAAVLAEVEDDGVPFDPVTRSAAVDVDRPRAERAAGGLGLHLVRELMDRFEYERRGEWNVVRVVKCREGVNG
jgi:anti-sigma regulatory factor (Ser/Thr protein kinase)